MRKLVGKLSALDPDASETLKIVAYFDKLVDGRVGADGLMRGATILSGVPIGRRPASSKTAQRFGVDGVELDPGPSEGWPSVSSADGSTVWLERSGAPHVNDSMVLECLAIALSILSLRLDRSAPARQAIEVLLASGTTEEQREEAAARFALGAHTPVYAAAVPVAVHIDRSLPLAVVATGGSRGR